MHGQCSYGDPFSTRPPAKVAPVRGKEVCKSCLGGGQLLPFWGTRMYSQSMVPEPADESMLIFS